MRALLFLLLLVCTNAWATDAASFQRTVALCADGTRDAAFPAGGTACDDTPPARVYRYYAGFDTAWGGNSDTLNGGYVTTLTTAGANACTGSATTLANYGPDSVYMVRREDSETALGSTITPHAGAGFMFQDLDVDLDYGSNLCVNGSTADKPRTMLSWNQSVWGVGGTVIAEYDEETIFHFSMFVPEDLEAENCGNNSLDVRETILSQVGNAPNCSSCVNFQIGLATETDGDTEPSIYVQFFIDPTTDTTGGATEYTAWLGDLSDDRGQWVEFVFVFRLNPYASETEVSGTYSETFAANSGKLEVYRTDPNDRDGDLIQVYDLATDTRWDTDGNVVSTSEAGVPSGLRDQFGLAMNSDYSGLQADLRMYKHAWGTGRSCPPASSTVTSGRYALGFDEVYWANTTTDSATCSDVTVNRVDCAAP